MKSRLFFKRYSMFSLIFILGVILWGAYVRFSHSGDGCGTSWPLCEGQFTPASPSGLVEWIHRVTSGLSLLIVFGLVFSARKIYPKTHGARKLSLLSGLLILVEALIGALLVVASLTGSEDSGLRVIVLAVHLVNSLLLTAVLILCGKSAFSEKLEIKKPFVYFVFAFPLLALTGSVASLAGTLFPSESLTQAFISDFLPESHITLRLRPLHPLFTLGFLFSFLALFRRREKTRLLIGAGLTATLSGLSALLFLSPVWMKLSHLLTAYILWIVLINSAFQPPRRTD